MEFNVVKNNHISEILLGTETNGSIFHEKNIHTHHDHHAGGNIWHERHHSSTPINDDDDNNYYNDHENFITENNFHGDHHGGVDIVGNDIEIIAIDPNQEYSSDEDGVDDDDEEENEEEREEIMNVFEGDPSETCDEPSSLITIENVKAALQASGHSRVSRQSLSLPHSPTRYSMDFSGISFDDLDIHSHFPDLMMHNVRSIPIVDSVDAVKTFDLASYITQDDNFEVISPAKVLPNTNLTHAIQEPFVNTNLINATNVSNSLPIHNNNNNTTQNPQQQQQQECPSSSRKRRTCVLSSKRMHYQVPSSDDNEYEENDNEVSSDNENNVHNNNTEQVTDNTKVDPTWMPFKVKDTKVSKNAINATKIQKKVKEPKMKKAKSAPVKPSKPISNIVTKTGSQQQKNLLKVCKGTSRTRILNATGQLSKDKIHKITKPPVGKNINLDHDYCTAKQKPELSRRVSQRKAIEIPIMDATIDKKLNRTIKKEESVSSKTVTSGTKRPLSSVETVSSSVQVSLLKSSNENNENQCNPTSVKRKLNLAEYMQRQEVRHANDMKKEEAENPILAAKRKALRKQELKKEAKMKDMEPKMDNGPLLPILPLAEITGMVKSEPEPVRVQINPEYEEIVIVSMGVNTEISIPPAADDEKSLLAYVNDTIKKVKGVDRGVVQFSNSLISSIQDVVLKKGNASLPTDISSPDCGLTPTHGMSPGKPEMAKSKNASPVHKIDEGVDPNECKEKEHGEDKVIMHLRKNRPRPETRSTSMQTLDVPSFIPLRRLSPQPTHTRRRSKSRDGRTRSRSQHYNRRSASRHSSSRNDAERCEMSPFRRSRSRHRTLSESSTSSSSSSSSSDSTSSCDGNFKRDDSPDRYRNGRGHVYYNSASSRRSSSSYSSRSRSRESIRYRPVSRGRDRNRSRQNEDPEKRNIVYVGQLEQDLSKEALRKKFIAYGLVTNVSIHLKENGMRYGFITFAKPEEAYRAIDSSSKDPSLNTYDISFGGRRAFCGSHYADLDGINSYINYHQISYPIEPYESSVKKHEEAESFEDMLKKLKASINAKKPTTS